MARTQNPQPSLTSTTFSNKLTFPDELASDEPTPTRATVISIIKQKKKEKLRHIDNGQKVESGQEFDSREDCGMARRSLTVAGTA